MVTVKLRDIETVSRLRSMRVNASEHRILNSEKHGISNVRKP